MFNLFKSVKLRPVTSPKDSDVEAAIGSEKTDTVYIEELETYRRRTSEARQEIMDIQKRLANETLHRLRGEDI